MKKTLALVLAALMTAGMTTVAFAAGPLDVNLMDDEGSGVAFFDKDDDNYFEASEVVSFGAIESTEVDGGVKVAIPLWDKAGNKIDDEDVVEGKVGERDQSAGRRFIENSLWIYALIKKLFKRRAFLLFG